MDLNDARDEAKALLHEILKTQPTFLQQALHQHNAHGKEAAKACSDFIEAYAAYLQNRKK